MTHNRFLNSLAPVDRDALAPHLRQVALQKGDTLIEQGEIIGEVHFPHDAQLTNVIVLADGHALETSLVGREGISGLAPVMAGVPCGWRVTVRVPGEALVLRAETFRSLLRSQEGLRRQSLELASFYETQAAQTAACNLAHTTPQRLARWLLWADDLAPDAALQFTQEEMAGFLGAQRTTVNDAAGALKADKTLKYSRGAITVLNRAGLERHACECYAILRERARQMNVALPTSD